MTCGRNRHRAPAARTFRRMLLLAACALVACGDDAGPGHAVDGAPPYAHVADAAADAADAAAAAGRLANACKAPSTDAGVADIQAALTLEAPAQPPIGAPFVVAVSAASTFSGDVALCLDGRNVAELHVYRGLGSATLQLDQSGPMRLMARAAHAYAELAIEAVSRPVRRLTGQLRDADLVWDAGADVLASGDLRVAAGDVLRIEKGTRVLLEANAAIEVKGEISVTGSADAPVLFTRAGSDAWGGLRLLDGSRGTLEHAWLTGGGGDDSRQYGHSDSQPLVWIDTATLEFTGGGIVDNPGKALGAVNAQVSVHDALLSRCDTGGQLNHSQVLIERSHVLEMPDADGELDDDDNDGIYLSGVAEDADGAPILSVIRDSVFAVGEDDAIDHNNAEVRVERVWIRGLSPRRRGRFGRQPHHGRRLGRTRLRARHRSRLWRADRGRRALPVDRERHRPARR